MNDDQAKIQQELSEIQNELNTTGMSRRNFLDRLKGVGLGFGAVAVVGTTAAQAHTGDNAVSLKSTNTAVGKIVEENQNQEAAEVEGDNAAQTAQYYYRRFYRRYGRVWYRRYGRVFYRRFYYRRFGW
jgi:hypothetical protein